MSLGARTSGDARHTVVPQLSVADVTAKASSENFPVASRFLPARYRTELLALYGFARLVDDIGDLASGDRNAQLDWVEDQITASFESTATHPVFVALSELVGSTGIDRSPFDDLVAANRQDQLVTRYERYSDLLEYCSLSANPVGRVVLAIFGRHDEQATARSDQVCSALQIIEHCQDAQEDFHAGRIYLPLEDLREFSVAEEDLGAPSSTDALRRLIAFEVGRTRELLDAGAPLVSMLSGWARVAVAGFVGGGYAQLDAIERSSFDVLSAPVKAAKSAVLRTTTSAFFHSKVRK